MTPRYSVTQDGPHAVLTDAETPAVARIDTQGGNNVVGFRVQPPGAGAPVDVFLSPSGSAAGYAAGNPILFPFPNRVRGGTYVFEGRTHQLDVNETARGNHIHGLVSRVPWNVEASGADPQGGAWQRASVDLERLPDVPRQYPFPCRLTVTTRLREGVLIQDIRVENTGPGSLPMGFGTHPWFPGVLDGGAREATAVRVPGNRYWRLEGLVPTGETLPVEGEDGRLDLRAWRPLDDLDLDDVFTDLVRRPDGWSEAGIRYPSGLEIQVEASPEFREWVIYAPVGRPVVCLEPYTGTTDAVNLQTQGVDAGLVTLAPGAAWSGTIRTGLRHARDSS